MKSLPWILVAVLSLILLVTWNVRPGYNGKAGNSDTVWMPVRTDTIHDTIPVLVSSVPDKPDTVLLPVIPPSVRPSRPSGTDSLEAVTDSIPMDLPVDSIGAGKPDSVWVEVPIVRQEWKTEDCRIVTSGYRTEVLLVENYRRTSVGIVGTSERKHNKRWGVGPCISWGVTPSGSTELVLGLSLHFSLFRF